MRPPRSSPARSWRPPHPILIVLVAGFALPLVWMVLASFKPAVQPDSELWPRAWTTENYARALADMDYARRLANSIVLSVLSVAGTLVSCSMAAYGFSRITWPGRDALFLALVATMLLPFHVTMLPRFQLFAAWGLYNTYWPLVIPNWLASEGFYVFMLRQFFLTIPRELTDAAKLDGAGEWTIFTRIVLPLSTPALATVALFQFLNTWNSFSGPLLFLNDPRKFPLAYALQEFVSSHRTEYGPLMAAAVLFTLPAVVLFVLAQSTFLRGIATTGIKG